MGYSALNLHVLYYAYCVAMWHVASVRKRSLIMCKCQQTCAHKEAATKCIIKVKFVKGTDCISMLYGYIFATATTAATKLKNINLCEASRK